MSICYRAVGCKKDAGGLCSPAPLQCPIGALLVRWLWLLAPQFWLGVQCADVCERLSQGQMRTDGSQSLKLLQDFCFILGEFLTSLSPPHCERVVARNVGYKLPML